MNKTIKITNEDVGILFHPRAPEMRNEALAFLILRIICQSDQGMLKSEIKNTLCEEYNWEITESSRDEQTESTPVLERTLLYLQNPSLQWNGFVDPKSPPPFISIRLRQIDRKHVFQATENGFKLIDGAKLEYDTLMQNVSKNATILIEQKFGKKYQPFKEEPGLRNKVEELIIDKLKRIAFDEAKDVLKTLKFSKKDITAFEKYHSKILSNVSKDKIAEKIRQLSQKLSVEENVDIFQDTLTGLINNLKGETTCESWEEFILAYIYNSLLFTILPYLLDTSLNQYLSKQVKKTRLCLDTNVLLAILLDFDRDHSIAIEILHTLKDLKVQLFWHDLAEEEIRKKFKVTRDSVEAIKALPPPQRRNVLNAMWSEGYINTFFSGEYKSTLDMERTVFKKLNLTKKSQYYAKLDNKHFFEFEQTLQKVAECMKREKWSEVQEIINNAIRKKFSCNNISDGIHSNHDSTILQWVYGLRQISKNTTKTAKEGRYLAHHWIVSLDKELLETANKIEDVDNSNLNQPLAISLRTLRLIVDPADLIRAIKNSSIPESLEKTWMDRSFRKKYSRIIELTKRDIKEGVEAPYIREIEKRKEEDIEARYISEIEKRKEDAGQQY